ncbi:hypothetical protein [Pseudoalteromonas sp. T1lg75]|uniref:hypothetical protein n=1 Tax=Pseudoalteromonas sp. T1lg75 TaxID=2077102 RepID=UPI001319F642|nr:hypothetical protein [Pseudoalteromonas sp. T1lg75]
MCVCYEQHSRQRGSTADAALPPASSSQLIYVPPNKIKDHSPLIIGETHGTQEVLLFLTKLIKSEHRPAESTAVLLELPADLNPLIELYLKGESAQDALVRHPFWHRKVQDGRSSQAIVDFLESVKVARDNGAVVEVYGYDRKRDGSQRPSQQGLERENIMVNNVSAYLKANKADTTFIVTGRVHAKKNFVYVGDIPSLANQLSDVHRVTSVNMVANKGSYWACFAHPVKTFDCGVKEIQTKSELAAQYLQGEGVYLFPKASSDFDGELYFERVQFSPPVITSQQQ